MSNNNSELLKTDLVQANKGRVILEAEMVPRILVVDDDRQFRALLSRVLREMGGFSVEESESAEDALRKTAREVFDVVLVDLNLPKMDGLELITRLVNTKPKIHTILVTGTASIDSAVEAMKRGARDYLAKPFKLEEMIARVRKVLEEKRRFVNEEENEDEDSLDKTGLFFTDPDDEEDPRSDRSRS